MSHIYPTHETLTAGHLDSTADQLGHLATLCEVYESLAGGDPSDRAITIAGVEAQGALRAADETLFVWECDERASTDLFDSRLRSLRALWESCRESCERSDESCHDSDLEAQYWAERELRAMHLDYLATRGV